jgi:drug/metabolite transporter (DMT)-like permease
MALVYGALLLNEPVGLNAIGGLILVLVGIFVTGKKTEQKTTPSIAPETPIHKHPTHE